MQGTHNIIKYNSKGLALSCLVLLGNVAHAEEVTPIIQVTDSAIGSANSVIIKPTDQNYIPVDAADILKSVPGANVNKNGPMTGISQYRGMFGSRINVQLDGLNVAPAGPNWMDPPLSHVAPSQLDNITVIRGISPVSAGAESIGGTVTATTAKLPYASGDTITSRGNLITGYNSNNNAFTTSTQVGMGSASNRIQLNGSFDKGQDTKAGNDLDIVPTQFQRNKLGVEYGHLFNSGDFNLGYGHEKVDRSGSPALPMDIIYVKSNGLTAGFKSNTGQAGVQWIGDMHYLNTDHLMDNFSLRSPPLILSMPSTPVLKRLSLSNAKDFAYKLQATSPANNGTLTIGTDGWRAKHNADVFDPNNAAFSLQNYNDVKRDRFSLFTEWKAPLTSSLEIQTGIRYSRVNMDSGSVSASGSSGMMATVINTLANNFNASQRNQNDNLLDMSLQITQTINDNLKFYFGAARKQRAPSYQERYLWSPLESTAGLADKRTYVGDVNLKPETAYNVDAGLDWESDSVYFTPHIFYKRVNNYIQGTALTSGAAYNFRQIQGNMLLGSGFCTVNPLNSFCVPLQFSNVDAELYGADAGFGANLTEHVSMDGTISYVRGKRRDIKDNLYRIAPLNSTIGISYFDNNSWSVTTEAVLYDKQNQVSANNSEQVTAGYSLFNLHGRFSLNQNIEFTAGVNNLFDRFYQNHLSGYNRITTDASGESSAVTTGSRLPGEGRTFFLQARADF